MISFVTHYTKLNNPQVPTVYSVLKMLRVFNYLCFRVLNRYVAEVCLYTFDNLTIFTLQKLPMLIITDICKKSFIKFRPNGMQMPRVKKYMSYMQVCSLRRVSL